ncbi:ribosomal RNA small subunit methyltransferase E [Tersicoccus solisilvae]|uniref:Ribosomal RNA small subunit methyltransferase E n=1 Tax=Tersicoccus solisilvae TaxID=1882339 RepID=A0ABQ1NQN0_9MICC|nr:16S rRNA (uracil(1498)-N(3))-methyltransferase [Tersicoccus solisilvae]GGC82916.1 ribosomal RNA small subunit methyltransferase E [Tersicoccus solisilvae]
MSAPVFYPTADLSGVAAGGRFRLDGPEGRHAATVRRIGSGETVEVCDGDGRRLTCVVVGVGRDALELSVRSVTIEPAPAPVLELVQALAKGDRDLQAIETATELGVDVVVPWQADRSIVRWHADRAAKAAGKWESTLRAAAQQSRRARIPRLAGLTGTRALAARIAAGTADGSLAAVVLHEDAAAPLGAVLAESVGADGPARVLVIVGPEGGIGPDELGALTGAGARTAVLGPHVLRSSTAGPAAIALASVQLGRWPAA